MTDAASMRQRATVKARLKSPKADNIAAKSPTFRVRAFPRRFWIAGLLLTAFLTVQLAAAAYACMGSRYASGLPGSPESPGQAVDVAGMMASCPEMAEQSTQTTLGSHDGLCLEHCQLGAKSVDHATPQIPGFLPVLVSLVEPAPVAELTRHTVLLGEAIARAPPPPIPILHCCFRT